MLSVKESRITLAQMGMGEEQLDEYEKNIEPFIEFHRFVMETHDISSKDAEKLADDYVKTFTTDYVANNDTSETVDFELAGLALEEFAIKQGYDKSDTIKESTIKLAELLTTAFKDKFGNFGTAM